MIVTAKKSFSLSKVSTRRFWADIFILAKTISWNIAQRVFLFFKNNKQRFARFAVVVALALAAVAPVAALAQTPGAVSTTDALGINIIRQPLGLPTTDIRVIIANIIKIALSLLGMILFVIFIYAGWLWMTAGGNDEQIATAKKMLQNAVIGLAIILMAYAIVAFVLLVLGVGNNGPGNDLAAPGSQNFTGSGALGSIIKDHYPARNQTGVPRNTKIIITFRKPIRPDSIINENSGNTVYGDCKNIGPQMNWETDCDTLKLDNDHINILRADNKTPIRGANVIAFYENARVFTLVIRPFDYLGQSDAEVPYIVHVGNRILIDDPSNNNPSIFSAAVVGNNYYEWKFTCSTILDTTPPYVSDVFPKANTHEAKNSVVQIDFSEAMDPTGMQGQFQAAGNYYALDGNTIFLQSGASSIPLGNFSLVNGYKTLEFTPSLQCATNACGQKIFCLPVCDRVGGTCPTDQDGVAFDNYKVLVRSASTFSSSSFDSIPFSGASDVAGNALDGNADVKVNSVDRLLPVFAVGNNPQSQERPDNYTWGFGLRDAIDLSPPYIRQITPGLDAQFISASSSWQMLFNKRMRIEPFYSGVQIAEKPSPATRGDNIPICIVPHVSFLDNGYTSTTMQHCDFRDTKRQYYFPLVNSDIQDAHFNCFYPGLGPGGAAEVQQHNGLSNVCNGGGTNCCQVDVTDPTRVLCCNGAVGVNGVTDPASCTSYLIQQSP